MNDTRVTPSAALACAVYRKSARSNASEFD